MTIYSPSIAIESWDEEPFDVTDGTAKLTQASVRKAYSGDVDGTSQTETLMAYAEDGTASFVGIERIVGTIDGKAGSLVLQHVGRFEDGAARASVTVVSGASSGDLRTIAGGGDFVADPNPSITLTLEIDG